jgi:hypothetical protein
MVSPRARPYSSSGLTVQHVSHLRPLSWTWLPFLHVSSCPTPSGCRHCSVHHADQRIQTLHILCQHCLLQPEHNDKLVLWRYGRLANAVPPGWDRSRKADATEPSLANCNANPGFVPVASGGDSVVTQFCKSVSKLLASSSTLNHTLRVRWV